MFGTVQDLHGQTWYIPMQVAGGPAVYTSSLPPGYTTGNSACIASVVGADPYCVQVNWDNTCANAYAVCAGGTGMAGCMDANACNYAPTATTDNSTCTFPTWYIPASVLGGPAYYGCYPPAGYVAGNAGCIAQVVAGDSYCSNVNWDGLCAGAYTGCAGVPVPGCTLLTACNYAPQATVNNGSCVVPGDACDDGNPDTGGDVVLPNCTCAGTVVSGCTYPEACNYDATATVDDGSCAFAPPGLTCTGGCAFDVDLDGVCDQVEVSGCTEPTACNFHPGATDSGYCVFAEPHRNCAGDCLEDVDGDAICDAFEVAGCTVPGACNFSAEATDDDGGCEWFACLPAPHLVVDSVGTSDHGTVYRVYVDFGGPGPELLAVFGGLMDGLYRPLHVVPQTGFYNHPLGADFAHDVPVWAYAFFPDAAADSWFAMGAMPGQPAGGLMTAGLGSAMAAFNQGGAFALNGDVGGGWFGVPGAVPAAIAGADGRVLIAQLTTAGAFDMEVHIQYDVENSETRMAYGLSHRGLFFPPCGSDSDGDGTCDEAEVEEGCTYAYAVNFNAMAVSDDGSCMFPECGTSCLGDIDEDGNRTTSDLLLFLSVFGEICD